MRCEVHSSDLDVFVNSLKRVADDVRSVPDEKGSQILFFPITPFGFVSALPDKRSIMRQFASVYKKH